MTFDNETATTSPPSHNKVLDDEIRARLNKLNALSDLINSLEGRFDEANHVFKNTLKISTSRLSSIAKTLGSRSLKQARMYHTAKVSVEQSQSNCQRACVKFEQANKEHQIAKKAIQEVELKLRDLAGNPEDGVIKIPNLCTNSTLDFGSLSLIDKHKIDDCSDGQDDNDNGKQDLRHSQSGGVDDDSDSDPIPSTSSESEPPTTVAESSKSQQLKSSQSKSSDSSDEKNSTDHDSILESMQSSSSGSDASCTAKTSIASTISSSISIENNNNNNNDDNVIAENAARLSEQLDQAIIRLFQAEKLRTQCEKQHLDETSHLILAQEKLLKLERDHGPSIKRSQLYFDEAKLFDAKLSSVKAEICRLNEEIVAAKQAYAQTLGELERFSEDLHIKSEKNISAK